VGGGVFCSAEAIKGEDRPRGAVDEVAAVSDEIKAPRKSTRESSSTSGVEMSRSLVGSSRTSREYQLGEDDSDLFAAGRFGD
jgi:hypothetical protein